jgi:hypothetical protein
METKSDVKGIAEAIFKNQKVKVIEVHLDNTVGVTLDGQRKRVSINELNLKPHEKRKIDYALGKKRLKLATI